MIIFRCDAGPSIGFGHLNRCRELARSLSKNGEPCMMIGPDKKYSAAKDNYIFNEWLSLNKWESVEEDAKKIISSVKKHSAKMVVLDDYRVNEVYQLILKKSGIKWLQFDTGLLYPLWADYVVNASPEINFYEYKKLIRNKNTKLLLGPKFSILRPEFSGNNLHKKNYTINKILVTFGGGDDRGAILFVLSSLLLELHTVNFLVVSGEYNPGNYKIKDWILKSGRGRVEFLINPRSIAPLFQSCDLAVMAGGTTIYEAAFFGLPMIIITIAGNQIKQSRAWDASGAAIYLGQLNEVSKDLLVAKILELNNSQSIMTKMGEISSKMVDGKGVYNIVKNLDLICSENKTCC